MTFIWVRMLWLLLVLPVLVGLHILLQRRKRKYALRYASLSMVKEALGRGPGFRRHVPPLLFLLGITVMIVALGRPAAVVTLPEQQGTVILTVDISGSMRAGDLQPNRLEAAKAAARAFVDRQPRNVRIGVVAFSATSAVVQAPTKEREEVLSAINRLATQRGTAIGSGILTSLNAVFEDQDEADEPAPSLYESLRQEESGRESVTPGAYSAAVVVLLSDGQSNQGPDPMEAAGLAATYGVRIFTVGVGSPEGAVLNFRGRSIRVQLDEAELKGIAATTNAVYFKADSETDLVEVYEALSTQLVMEREKTELTAFFTAFAAIVLLVAGYLSLLWLNRLP